MKIKTNVHAGKQTQNRGADNVGTEAQSSGVVTYYAPALSRCAGI